MEFPAHVVKIRKIFIIERLNFLLVYMYFGVRVTSGQEKITADILENKAVKENMQNIYAIVVPAAIPGYLIIECADEVDVRNLIEGVQHIRGMLSQPLNENDIDKILAQKKVEESIEVNDIIEFTAGPFKGYKAKVKSIDTLKDEMTVELIDVAVPIPVKTKMVAAKIIEKAKK